MSHRIYGFRKEKSYAAAELSENLHLNASAKFLRRHAYLSGERQVKKGTLVSRDSTTPSESLLGELRRCDFGERTTLRFRGRRTRTSFNERRVPPKPLQQSFCLHEIRDLSPMASLARNLLWKDSIMTRHSVPERQNLAIVSKQPCSIFFSKVSWL